MDIGRIQTDSFGPIIFTLLQKLMNACDPHQGGNVGAFDRIDNGSDTYKEAADSENKGDE